MKKKKFLILTEDEIQNDLTMMSYIKSYLEKEYEQLFEDDSLLVSANTNDILFVIDQMDGTQYYIDKSKLEIFIGENKINN